MENGRENGDSCRGKKSISPNRSKVGWPPCDINQIKHLSDSFQSPQLILGTAVTCVDSVVDTFISYREGSLSLMRFGTIL